MLEKPATAPGAPTLVGEGISVQLVYAFGIPMRASRRRLRFEGQTRMRVISSGLALDSGVATLPLALAQLKLLDLSGGCSRNHGYEFDVRGKLVSGDLPPCVPYDLFRRRGGTGVQYHESLGSLTPFCVRHPNDRHLQHGWVGDDGVLHLDRGDVLTAGDDDVLGPVT